MIDLIKAIIAFFIGDEPKKSFTPKAKNSKSQYNDEEEFMIFESSPDDTPEERQAKKDMEEYIIYEDLMDDR